MRVEWVRRGTDPSDIFQSVMASFFIRVALGQYDISSPEQLHGSTDKDGQEQGR